VRLMDNAERLLDVRNAFKIATPLGPDVATAGRGGEDLVGLTFTSSDAQYCRPGSCGSLPSCRRIFLETAS